MSPSAEKVPAVLPARSAAGPLSARVRLTASAQPLRLASIACCSLTSPFTTTEACGSEQSLFALAFALQLPRHSALAIQLSDPVQRGGLASAEHEPWHSPEQAAMPGVYEQVPLHSPLHITAASAVHEPVHIPMHLPPLKFPMHFAAHLPVALPVQVPSHLPSQVPIMAVPSHLPLHMPSQLPVKFAVQPTSQLPSKLGASQLPSQVPLQATAALALQEP